MKTKYICNFCGDTNTKIENITRGIFYTVVGHQEVVDENSIFYRCRGCGRIWCKKCTHSLGAHKEKVGIFSTKRWTECPKCSSEIVRLN